MKNEQGSARTWHRVEQLLAAVVLAWVGFRAFLRLREDWPFTTDDAYITLRYARHLAEGHGIVWNVGDSPSVEGYSNFLFVLLGAAALKLGVDPVLVLKASGCLALALSSGLLYVLARRWLSPLGATLPAALLLGFKGAIHWSVSGLETSVYLLWVVAGTVLAVRALELKPGASYRHASSPSASGSAFMSGSARSSLRLCSFTCLLASLTRPEGPVLTVILAATLLAPDLVRFARARTAQSQRDLALAGLRETILAFLFFFALPYASYFAWRVATFEQLLPNTVYCKSVYDGDPWFLHRHFWKDAKVFIVLALFQHPRRLSIRALPLFALPIVYALLLIGADPIIGYYSRHFLASLALLFVASVMGAANLAELATYVIGLPLRLVLRHRSSSLLQQTHVALWQRATQAGLIAAYVLWLVTRSAPVDNLGRDARAYARRMQARAQLGHYLDKRLKPEQSFLIGDAGMVPYLAHAKVIDAFCLNSREMTSPAIHFDRARFLDWVFSVAPDLLVVHSLRGDILRPRREYGFYPALVRDPRFAQNYQRETVFSSGADRFYYWVFRRRTPGQLPVIPVPAE